MSRNGYFWVGVAWLALAMASTVCATGYGYEGSPALAFAWACIALGQFVVGCAWAWFSR